VPRRTARFPVDDQIEESALFEGRWDAISAWSGCMRAAQRGSHGRYGAGAGTLLTKSFVAVANRTPQEPRDADRRAGRPSSMRTDAVAPVRASVRAFDRDSFGARRDPLSSREPGGDSLRARVQDEIRARDHEQREES